MYAQCDAMRDDCADVFVRCRSAYLHALRERVSGDALISQR